MSEVTPDLAVVEVHQGHEQPDPEPERESVQWRKRPITVETLFIVSTPLIVAGFFACIGLWNRIEVAAARMDERITAQSQSQLAAQLQYQKQLDHVQAQQDQMQASQTVIVATEGEIKGSVKTLSYMLTHVNDKTPPQ